VIDIVASQESKSWRNRLLAIAVWGVLLGLGSLVISTSLFNGALAEWSEARDGNFEENSGEWDDWKLTWCQPNLNQSGNLAHAAHCQVVVRSTKRHSEIRAHFPPIFLLHKALKLDC
jgi:hypothetical protein